MKDNEIKLSSQEFKEEIIVKRYRPLIDIPKKMLEKEYFNGDIIASMIVSSNEHCYQIVIDEYLLCGIDKKAK